MQESNIDIETIVAEKVMAYQLYKRNSMIEMLVKELNELRAQLNTITEDK